MFCHCNMQKNKKNLIFLLWNKKEFLIFCCHNAWGEGKPHWFFYFVVATHERVKDLALLIFFVLLVWCVKEGKKTLLILLFCCCDAWRNKWLPCFLLLFGWAKEWKKNFINFFGCDAWSNERSFIDFFVLLLQQMHFYCNDAQKNSITMLFTLQIEQVCKIVKLYEKKYNF